MRPASQPGRACCVLAALALAAAPACRREPARPSSSQTPQLRRLAADLGTVAQRTLDGDTRPSVRLTPGQARRLSLDLPEGGVLTLALAAGGATPASFARLTVSARGRVLLEARRHPRPWPRWHTLTVDLPPGRPLEIDLAAEFVDRAGALLPASESANSYLDVAAPRVLAKRPAGPRRVLVWVSLDTVRADRLSLYQNARATTPHLGRRAANWTVFEQAVSCSAWTLPAMVSQFTSRLPGFHGVVGARLARRDIDETLFERLAASGFTVLGVSANRFLTARFNLAAGFDTLSLTRGRADDVNRLALQALDDWPGGDLALFVHYMDPHLPYDPPPPWDTHFAAEADQLGGWPALSGSAAARGHDARLRARYDSELAWTDDRIEALLGALERRGLLHDALIVLSADHGEELDDRGGFGHGHTLHDELVHVPLALGLPGRAGRRIAPAVSLLDLAPTVLELLGVKAPATFQGRSLMPLLDGRGWSAQPAIAETSRDPLRRRQALLRDGGLKYVATVSADGASPVALADERLYDLEQDPGERAPQHDHPRQAELRRRLLAYVEAARAHAARPRPAALDNHDREELRALGYVE